MFQFGLLLFHFFLFVCAFVYYQLHSLFTYSSRSSTVVIVGSYDGKPDLKETFECGHEADPDFMNLWPSEAIMPGFRRAMLKFFYQADAVHLQVCAATAL